MNVSTKIRFVPYIGDDAVAVYTAICASELTYYVVPNYIDYPNAYFFIFNERKQGFFGRNSNLIEQYLGVVKKFVIVSNTEQDNLVMS